MAGHLRAHIAAAIGISRKWAKTWIDRFLAEGREGPTDRSSRPHLMARRASPEVEQQVLAARSEDGSGPDVLGSKLEVPAGPCRGSCAATRCPNCASWNR